MQARVRRLDANQSSPSIRDRHAFKAQGSSKKVSVLASLFPTLKITPCPPAARENYSITNTRGVRGCGPRQVPERCVKRNRKSVCSAEGWGSHNQTMRRGSAVTARREPTEPARHARAGREACYLHPAHPASVGSGRARAHTHTHIHRRVCVESPRAIPQPARIQRESKTGVSPG